MPGPDEVIAAAIGALATLTVGLVVTAAAVALKRGKRAARRIIGAAMEEDLRRVVREEIASASDDLVERIHTVGEARRLEVETGAALRAQLDEAVTPLRTTLRPVRPTG